MNEELYAHIRDIHERIEEEWYGNLMRFREVHDIVRDEQMDRFIDGFLKEMKRLYNQYYIYFKANVD